MRTMPQPRPVIAIIRIRLLALSDQRDEGLIQPSAHAVFEVLLQCGHGFFDCVVLMLDPEV